MSFDENQTASYESNERDEDVDGLERSGKGWGDYPIDDLLIRPESRTVYELDRRIGQGQYVMDPDFQREFIWSEAKQSKLIESVIMRIPLPVFYLAEDSEGHMVVVDGLQRLSTFRRFLANDLILKLPDRVELDRCRFEDLTSKYKNRVEDCNLTLYIIDSKVPERARLDIFERVNNGVPLSRQQMRNCLFVGKATRFLRDEAKTEQFLNATGKSLNRKTMRDREFINRFCAFHFLDIDSYNGDMDEYLAKVLRQMNKKGDEELQALRDDFHRTLKSNFYLFGTHAFRRSMLEKGRRTVLNASLWDVLSTTFSQIPEHKVKQNAMEFRNLVCSLLSDDDFINSITFSTNSTEKVKRRFSMVQDKLHGLSV